MDMETFRGIERLLVVACGALLIWCGYRLLLALPNNTDGTGKVVLPGGISAYVSRVGPGVFFALFGVALLGISVSKVYKEKDGRTYMNSPAGEQHPPQPKTVATAPSETDQSAGVSANAQSARRSTIMNIIGSLNKLVLPITEGGAPDPEKQTAAHSALHAAKVELIGLMWDDKNWGAYQDFKEWANQKPANTNLLAEPIAVFNQNAVSPR